MTKRYAQSNTEKFSPSDFMRGRRPALFSDALYKNEPLLDRPVFEYHLHTLTQRKEETVFEHFCRRLRKMTLTFEEAIKESDAYSIHGSQDIEAFFSMMVHKD